MFVGHPGNTFRGALGNFLRLTATPEQYAAIFEPVALDGPSGFRNVPRPFVLRCAHLHRKTFMPGETFRLGLNLFETRRAAEIVAVLRRAFARSKDEGIGLERNRAELIDSTGDTALQTILLGAADGYPVKTIIVEFQTPTELTGYDLKDQLAFGLLFRRVRDRISVLQSVYGEAFAGMDFRELGERGDAVETEYQDLEYRAVSRTSSRTGQTHPIGGFDGIAAYRGELTEFMPWLRAAEVTGVGRHTTWGNGEVSVTVTVGS